MTKENLYVLVVSLIKTGATVNLKVSSTAAGSLAMATFAAVNIHHLDAWVKHTNFSFVDTFMGVA